MELKLKSGDYVKIIAGSSNRTFMELKYAKTKDGLFASLVF